MPVSITREHEICCGHRVHGHEGKCRHLHGHNYKFELTCVAENGKLDSLGRVIDFSQVKALLCEWLEENWDHRFLIWEQDPAGSQLRTIDDSVVYVPFNPTAENIAEYFVQVVAPKQLAGTGIVLEKVVLWETGKCSATYEKGIE